MKKQRGPVKFSFDTFCEIGRYQQAHLTEKEPSCINDDVKIRKYRVTVEEIQEPKEVLIARLLKLWRESDNHHEWQPLEKFAKELGVKLDSNEFGKFRKR